MHGYMIPDRIKGSWAGLEHLFSLEAPRLVFGCNWIKRKVGSRVSYTILITRPD